MRSSVDFDLHNLDYDKTLTDREYFELREDRSNEAGVIMPSNVLINEIRGGRQDLDVTRDNETSPHGILKMIQIEQSNTWATSH